MMIQSCCPVVWSVLYSNTYLVRFIISLCFGVFTFFSKYKENKIIDIDF